MRKNNTSTTASTDRRSALKTIGAASVGLLGIRTLSGEVNAKYDIPSGGGSWPAVYTEVSEEKFTWRHTSRPNRHGALRKVTELAQEKPKDAAGNEVLTTIHVSQVTESRYTKETVERAGLNSAACYQQLNDLIEVTYPESFDPDKIHIRFRNDKDHVGGFEGPSGGDSGSITSSVPTIAVDAALRILQTTKRWGKLFARLSDVSLAIQLAKKIYKWGDTIQNLGHKWNWPIPNHAPDRGSEQPWVRGRSHTASWVRFDIIHNKNTPVNLKIHNSTLNDSGYGISNEFEYQVI